VSAARLALARLQGLSRFGVRFGLDRVRQVLGSLGDPQMSFPSIHIAGTNGKGSTAAMIESVLRASGLRAGLYTSPHLCRFSERIQVAGREISPERLTEAIARVLEVDPELSFFEAATAIGFLHFAEEQVELAVVETGLGGRLDATNVLVRPLVTVLTRIDLDHQEQLGSDLSAIAAEKAGILKPGVPVVSAPFATPEVARVVERRAGKLGAPLRVVGRELRVARGKGGLRFESQRGVVEAISLGLLGAHQVENATLALAALEEVVAAGRPIAAAALRDGLRTARWPGRLEWIAREGVLLDGAHNSCGAHALGAALAERGQGPYRVILGLLGPKDPRPVLAPLLPHLSGLIATRPRSLRALDPSRIAELLPGRATTAPDLASALAEARDGRDPILVTGSLYLVGEARALLLGEETDPIALADPLGTRAASG
jgi:dihydrofolate synthase/folylpolyglutamate synthase